MKTVHSGHFTQSNNAPLIAYNVCLAETSIEIYSAASSTDSSWTPFKTDIFQNHILPQMPGKTDIQIAELFATYNLEDFGWNWFQKALHFHTNKYLWFYLESCGEIQGMAVLYHPQKSFCHPHDIFYIDYLASAPWNRESPVVSKRFSNIGKILIKACTEYCMYTLKYTPGFNLHSLPKAETYYSNIGMTDLGIDSSKGNLKKFEMFPVECITFLQKGANL